MAPKAQGQCLLGLTGCFSHMVLQQWYSLNYEGFMVLSAQKIPRQLPYSKLSKSLRSDSLPIQFILNHFKAMPMMWKLCTSWCDTHIQKSLSSRKFSQTFHGPQVPQKLD